MTDNALLARILLVISVAVLSICLFRARSAIRARQKMARCLRAILRLTPTRTNKAVHVRPQPQRTGRFVRLLSLRFGKGMEETCPVRRSANSSRSVDFGAKANLSRVTLSRIPSLFGRLAYFASLRDPATGEYQHWGMSEIYGREEANKALRQSHTEAFSEWLCLDVEQREADFLLYRSGLEAEGFALLEAVPRLEPHRYHVPESAPQAAREVFQRTLIALLERLRHKSAVPLSRTYA
jgi:hypothetical protein